MKSQTYQYLIESLPFVQDQKALLGFGFYATVYFEDGHLPERRRAVLDVFEEYWSLCGSELKWMTHPTTHIWQKVDPSLAPAHWLLQQADEKHVWDFCYHGGRTFDECSAFRIHGYGVPASTMKLSYLSAAFPVTWFADREDLDALSVVKGWCDILRPLHGSAGLAILASLDVKREARLAAHVRGLARRFPGLEVDFPIHHCLLLHEGTKSVNWLNILDERWLSKLGGLESLRQKLDEDLVVYECASGVLIQAGPHPQAGDVNRRIAVDPYRRLSAVLKPIRASYPAPFLGFTAESTQQWLSRFD